MKPSSILYSQMAASALILATGSANAAKKKEAAQAAVEKAEKNLEKTKATYTIVYAW